MAYSGEPVSRAFLSVYFAPGTLTAPVQSVHAHLRPDHPQQARRPACHAGGYELHEHERQWH